MCDGLVNNWDVPDRNQKVYSQLWSLFHAMILDMHGLHGIRQNAPHHQNLCFMSKWTWIGLNCEFLCVYQQNSGHHLCIMNCAFVKLRVYIYIFI